MKPIYFFLTILISLQNLSAQEVFDNYAEAHYENNTEVKNFYDFNFSQPAPYWKDDFKNSGDYHYRLQGNAFTAVADRFGIPAQALYFRQYENENLIIPSAVVKNIVDNNAGFSISAWIKVPDNGVDCQILSFTNPEDENKEDIQLRMKDGYFQILKTSSVAQEKVVMGQSRYKISYYSDNIQQEIYPGSDEYGAGYIYFMLSSNKNSTRLYYSRPGGRLYANYFWFGLTDVLSDTHTITFGTVNQKKRTTILDAVDDIMVYNEMLSPEMANNHFLVQSPLYPSRSYILRDFENEPIAPEDNDEYNVYDNSIRVKTDDTSTERPYGAKRWLLSTRKMDHHERLFNFINAKTYLTIGPVFENNTESPYEQKSIESNSLGQLFEAVHISNNPNNVLDCKENAFQFNVKEIIPGNQLGIDENFHRYLNIRRSNMPDTEWSVQGSFNTSIRERFSPVSEAGITIFNYETNHSMTIDINDSYTLYQNLYHAQPFRLVKKQGTFNAGDYKYGYEDYMFYNMEKTAILTPKEGIKNTQNGISQRLMPDGNAAYQLMYVKDDPNGKPLYMIRTSNGYGAKVLVPDVHNFDNKLIVQDAHDEEEYAVIPDHFLWSVNVIYYYGNSNTSTKKASHKSSDLPVSHMLQVYPNPVKGRATVKYTLSKSTRVKLYITSSTGTLVKIIKEKPQNKGTYKETLTTTGWPSGIYFCNMQTDEGIITKKIIVQ